MTPTASAICEQPKSLGRPGNRVVKRIIDVLKALVGLAICILLIPIFGLLIKLESSGPVIFRQKRMGRDGKAFYLFKMRSMRQGAEADGPQWTRKNDPRRLRVGAFMRKWNIDEVPQFWNVLKGDMSLVGPRPERPEFISNFRHQIPNYHVRHSCLPGMSGWAQVNGWRGDTSLTRRIECDLWYIENWTFILDIRIMFKTFLCYQNAA